MAKRQSLQLPDRTFVGATVDNWEGKLIPCDNLWGGSGLSDPVIAKTPLKKAGWATLFAYMHRRFGPPHLGGDDYKDLSGAWMLMTPDPDVLLRVGPHLCGPSFSFHLYLVVQSDELSLREMLRDGTLPKKRVAAIRAAYRTALLDLLRPVCIRDSHINALGELEESPLDEALLDYDEESEEVIYEVERHSSSGYPMPQGLFGGEDWGTLCGLIHGLGKGDMEKGRAAVIALLQRAVFAEAAGAGWAVHRLMLMGGWRHQDRLAADLGLTVPDNERFQREMKVLHDQTSPDYRIVEEMTDEAAAAAADYLDRLGYDGDEVPALVRRLRRDKAGNEAWSELLAIAKDDFPDDALPKKAHQLGTDFAGELKKRFEICQRPDLVAWVERTLARPAGEAALYDITWYLVRQIADEAAKKA